MATAPETKEKIWNVVCYFALEHERRTRKPLSDTALYDYMIFLDSASIEKTGRPALDQSYRKREIGSLLTSGREKREKVMTDRLVIIPHGESGYIVRATREPNLHCFSPFELAEMKRLVRTYSHRFAKAADSNKEANGATGIWKRLVGTGTDTDLEDKGVSGDGSLTLHKEKATMSNLHALTEKYMTQVKDLESQLADVRHKLEIVMEASRLLAEEGFSDDFPVSRIGSDKR